MFIKLVSATYKILATMFWSKRCDRVDLVETLPLPLVWPLTPLYIAMFSGRLKFVFSDHIVEYLNYSPPFKETSALSTLFSCCLACRIGPSLCPMPDAVTHHCGSRVIACKCGQAMGLRVRGIGSWNPKRRNDLVVLS